MTVVARDNPLHPGDEGTSSLAPPPENHLFLSVHDIPVTW